MRMGCVDFVLWFNVLVRDISPMSVLSQSFQGVGIRNWGVNVSYIQGNNTTPVGLLLVESDH